MFSAPSPRPGAASLRAGIAWHRAEPTARPAGSDSWPRGYAMVLTTWRRVAFHLSLTKAGCCADATYTHLTDEETEGGREGGSKPQSRVQAMRSAAEPVPGRLPWVVTAGLPHDHCPRDAFLEQEASLEPRVGQPRGRAEGGASLGAVGFGNSSFTCASAEGDNRQMIKFPLRKLLEPQYWGKSLL